MAGFGPFVFSSRPCRFIWAGQQKVYIYTVLLSPGGWIDVLCQVIGRGVAVSLTKCSPKEKSCKLTTVANNGGRMAELSPLEQESYFPLSPQ